MENSTTWGKLEQIIDNTMAQHNADMEQGIIGVSLVRAIADAIREAVAKGEIFYIVR